jgi:2-polyprenyl-3-methyl-5-hydroxy-6-metoxy-1,4-benzoquinol methylase
MSDRTGPQPSPIPQPDRHQIERLNSLYQIIDAPAGGGLKSRLASTARRLLGRVLSRQQEFNAALVDHLNRDAAVAVEAHEASLRTIEWIGGAINQWDGIRRHTESLLARDRRNDTSVAALAAQHDELRSAVSVLQQAAQNLKREVSRLAASTPPASNSQLPTPKANAAPGSAADTVPGNQFDDLDSHKYVGFEDQFRGSPEDIQRRVAEYLPMFLGMGDQGSGIKASDVLDVGCGRGEFLELLRDQGITARGIDVNPAMVDVCCAQGLDAVTADALTYLRGLPDGSLGGLFAAQVVEHLEPRYLMQLLDAAFDKLRPGAPIVLETINPACWFAFFESYIRDLTHVRPVHPDTLKYLLIATGFQHVEIRYRAPYPESDKLQSLAAQPPAGFENLVATLNENVEKINRLLFTYLDYAAIGKRA